MAITTITPIPGDSRNTTNTTSSATASSNSTRHTISLAAMLDRDGFPWAEEVLQLTVNLLNDRQSGWYSELLPQDTQLEISFSDDKCDADVAVRAWIELYASGKVHHGIVGCSCSGSSIDVARLVMADNSLMVSPTASSPKLSNKDDYPTFSRLVGPDNAKGQVGALIKVLRRFGWKRISIVTTDTDYTRDFYAELSRSWEGPHDDPEDPFTGEIGYKGTIPVLPNEGVELQSVRNVLANVPIDNPSIHSKVIVLLANHKQAFTILKAAYEMNFPPDTIWIGTDAWTDRFPPVEDSSWLPTVPGYIGVVPFRNKNSLAYLDFLQRLQSFQRLALLRARHHSNMSGIFQELPDSADRTIDSLLALTMALSQTDPSQRRNGTFVTSVLRNLVFQGVSGTVQFTKEGDADNPKYTVMTLPNAQQHWLPIGSATPLGAAIDFSKVCFPARPFCGGPIPSEKYPMPVEPLDTWMIAILALLAVVAVVLAIVMYLLRSKWKKSSTLSERLKLLQEEIGYVDAEDNSVRRRKVRLYKEFARLLGEPAPWPDGAPGLVEITPTQQEYWQVHEQLRLTMGQECHLSKLQKVQNDPIWSYYVFRKNQLANKYNTHLNDDETLREINVWHGTSSLNPDVIHSNNQHGFMMQYSSQGLYGRGIYFSERSGYSDCYSYRVHPSGHRRGSRDDGDREMFLVKLLLGRSKELNHNESDLMREYCRSLVMPPEEEGELPYDSVTGQADCGTKMHVVFDNGRAYPQYLVRYYKGPRDPARTKFISYKDATTPPRRPSLRERLSRSMSMSEASTARTLDGSDVELTAPTVTDDDQPSTVTEEEEDEEQGDLELRKPWEEKPREEHYPSTVTEQVVWEYQDDTGIWISFTEGMQLVVEQIYQANPLAVFPIETDLWTYEIDLQHNTQTNLDHPDHTQRLIRRRRRIA